MNNATTVAVAKVIKAAVLSAARNELLPGEYPIDATLTLSGYIRVAEDTDKVPTVNIPILDALALLVHDAGITGKHALSAIQRAMTRALQQDDDAKRIIQEQRENLERAEIAVRSTLDALPRVPVRGKVTTKLEIETLDPVPA